MARFLNVVLTCGLLAAALFVWLASIYDGYCYGFTDGMWSCSLADHVEANLAWLPFMLFYFFPHVFIIGYIVYSVNGAIYRAVLQRRVRRWLEAASVEDVT